MAREKKKKKKTALDESIISVTTFSGDIIELSKGTICYVAYGQDSYIIR